MIENDTTETPLRIEAVVAELEEVGQSITEQHIFDDTTTQTPLVEPVNADPLPIFIPNNTEEEIIFETEAVIAETPWGLMGLTICYDIRFPHLFRDLAKAGARVIFSPAAFTQLTGEAHWHILQRARAIENGCFIVSPAQVGIHANSRQTYGHSLVVDPWGSILADGGTTTGYIMADIDLSLVEVSQNKVPSLSNDRHYTKAF